MRNIRHHHHTHDLYGFAALIAVFIAALFFARLAAGVVIAAGTLMTS